MRGLSVSFVVKVTIAAVIGILLLKWLTSKVNIPVVGPAVQKV